MRRRAHGFTLIELLVAVSVLALLAVFAWRGLDQIVRTRTTLQQSQQALDALQRLFANIARDAAAARLIRVDGAGRIVFVMPTSDQEGGQTAGQGVVAQDRPAPPVEYLLEGGRVVRRDGLPAGEQALLTDVVAWQGVVRQANGQWGASPDSEAMPSALRVTVSIGTDGGISRIFLLRD